MSWEDLTIQEKKEWDEAAFKNQEFLQKLKVLAKLKKCPMCKVFFPRGVLEKNPSKIIPLLEMIKGDFLFHFQSTHGIPPDIFKLFLIEAKV